MVEGLLGIDKPSGHTSHDMVYALRRLSGIRRVGHCGTLDPLATGLLILCLGRATRLSEYVMGHDKVYEATIRLGQTTNSYDAQGEIITTRPITVTAAEIVSALAQFQGSSMQIPPMFSAIKQQGQPLYKLARKGKVVAREPRPITITQLQLRHWAPPDLHIEVHCSAGTYIRSLAHDLGEVLGCGGHITRLHRTRIGTHHIDTAAPWAQLTPETWHQYLQPADTAVAHLPAVQLTATETLHISQGKFILRQPDHPAADLIRLYDEKNQFVGLAVTQDEFWQARKILYPRQISA